MKLPANDQPAGVSSPAQMPQAEPARVLVSGMKLGLGAIRTHLVLLCRLLLQNGTRVELYAHDCQWSPALVGELRALGLRIHLPPAPFWTAPRLGRLYALLLWPLQIPRRAASLYCMGPGRSHLWLHRLKPRGVLSINHEIIDAPAPGSLPARCATVLDATIANSRKVAQLMKEHWPHKPMRVIPFLTADRPTPPPARNRLVGQGVMRVTYLGRLVSHKRPDQLVRRWPALSAAPGLRPAHLDVYGYDPTGEMLEELRAFVAQAHLSEQVRIHGNYELDLLPGILAESDLVVLPSLDEGLPLVLVEAMLHGVPFVATAAGGTEELGDGNPDVVVTAKEWEAFEAGLVRMAGRIRAGQMDALRLHRWAEDRYGFTPVSERWLKCLQQPSRFFACHD